MTSQLRVSYSSLVYSLGPMITGGRGCGASSFIPLPFSGVCLQRKPSPNSVQGMTQPVRKADPLVTG